MSVYTISHININVADLDASVHFYIDDLGLNLVRRVGAPSESKDVPSSETAIINTGERGVSLENIQYDLGALESSVPPTAPSLGVIGLHLELTRRELDGSQLVDPDGVLVGVSASDRNRIAGVDLLVANVDETRRHWKQSLDLQFLDAPEGSDYDAFVEVRSSQDQFRITIKQADLPAEHTSGYQLGARRLAFTVDDVEQSYSRAMADGARSESAPAQFELGPVKMIAGLWFDPNGVVLQGLQFIKEPKV
ncbi:MAG: VOC family protein [Actinomycetota bacterium]|nr:VOC family protein [Actinomycetota bacterium]